MELISGLGEAVIGGTITGGLLLLLVRYWLGRVERDRATLTRKVDDLSDHRMRRAETGLQELENRVSDHERNDSSREILMALKHMDKDFKRLEGVVIGMDGKLDYLSDETGRQSVQIDGNSRDIDRARTALTEHKKEGHNNA